MVDWTICRRRRIYLVVAIIPLIYLCFKRVSVAIPSSFGYKPRWWPLVPTMRNVKLIVGSVRERLVGMVVFVFVLVSLLWYSLTAWLTVCCSAALVAECWVYQTRLRSARSGLDSWLEGEEGGLVTEQGSVRAERLQWRDVWVVRPLPSPPLLSHRCETWEIVNMIKLLSQYFLSWWFIEYE